MICMACLFPFFLLGMYEKNGVPAEKLLYYSIRRKVLRPEIRPRMNRTRFEEEEYRKKVRKEIAALERKAASGGRRTKDST